MSDKMLSRAVTLSGFHDGEEKQTTFYTLPETPKDTAEWEAKAELEHEGWIDVEVIDSEITTH